MTTTSPWCAFSSPISGRALPRRSFRIKSEPRARSATSVLGGTGMFWSQLRIKVVVRKTKKNAMRE